MSTHPLRNLLLVLVVAGFGTVALSSGQLDSLVSRAAMDFVASGSDTSAPAGEGFASRSPHGMWSFEFE